jgi:hypothetical protein
MSKKEFARSLEYINHLLSRGKLSFLRNKALIGDDVDIQFRGKYLNLYYKGASLLKFEWRSENTYEITISDKYLKPIEIKWLDARNKLDDASIQPIRKNFKEIVKLLKINIRCLGKGKENAFEQIFIENNLNIRNEPSFKVIDRQVVIPGSKDRLDIVALSRIKDSAEYRLNLIELKYGEDKRIEDVYDNQLHPYYLRFKEEYPSIVEQYQKIIEQKKRIGLLPQITEKITISKDPKTMRKIAVFGNIKKNHNLISKAKQRFDENTFYAIQNNILEKGDLKNATDNPSWD